MAIPTLKYTTDYGFNLQVADRINRLITEGSGSSGGSPTVQTLADAVELAELGGISVGDTVTTNEYHSGTGLGGNKYQLVDGGGSRPTEDGGSVIYVGTGDLYLKGLFPNGVWIEQFGANTSIDNSTNIVKSMDYVSSEGLGSVKGLGGVYPISSLTLVGNVVLEGPSYNALNVQHMAVVPAANTGGLVLQAINGSSGDLVLANDSSPLAGLKNLIIDASEHTGDVVVFDSSDGEVRNNNYLHNVLIWQGSGKQLKITNLNNGSLIENVFCRGGVSRESAISDYGIHDESQDSKIFNTFAAFCKLRCIYDNAGSGRRKDIDGWGCQNIGVEIRNSARYRGLQIDGCGLGGLKLSSCKNASIHQLKLVNNNKSNANVEGDIEAVGDCRGTKIVGVDLLGTDATAINHAIYQPISVKTGLSIRDVSIATNYLNQLSVGVETYWDLFNIRTPVAPISLMRSNQINPNVSLISQDGTAPTGWVPRNGGVSVVNTSESPVGSTSSCQITSSSSGTSGIMFTRPVSEMRNTRVRVKCSAKGSGLTFLGNQRVQIFDGVTNPFIEVPNDQVWTEIAITHEVPNSATNFQIRVVAGNDTTPNLVLFVRNLTIDLY